MYRHSAARGDGSDCTALPDSYWRNMDKGWQNGGNNSHKNDALQIKV